MLQPFYILQRTTETIPDVDPDESSVEGDRTALMDLYTAANGASWTNNTNWGGAASTMGTWYGVTTDANGRVTSINLKRNNLTGNINTATLKNLTRLTYFNVYFNFLGGNIPDFPADIEFIYLNKSIGVSTEDADDYDMWLNQLTTTSSPFHVGYRDNEAGNKFTGTIPASLGNCVKLKWFTCTWAQLEAPVPQQLENCVSLVGFRIGGQQLFNGANFPDIFGNWNNIGHVLLGSQDKPNNFGGPFPQSIQGKSKLMYFYAKRCGFTGTFPDMSASTDLKVFDMPNSTSITGTFPEEFFNGTCTRIRTILITGNFTGVIPENTNTFNQLRTLNISYGDFTGSLPNSIWTNNPGIIVTDFRNNQLSGIIGPDLTMLNAIRNLRWPSNDLYGPWPDLDWGTKTNSFTRFLVNSNRYTYSDMAPNFTNYQSYATSEFEYGSQKAFPVDAADLPRLKNGAGALISREIIIGSTDPIVLDLSAINTSSNVYQWQLDSDPLSDGSGISGVATHTLTLTGAARIAGVYTLRITNANYPSLSQSISQDITLT